MSEKTNQDSNIRKDYKDCAAQKLADFITCLEQHGAFIRKSYIPIGGASHFERFNYVCGKDKVSIVYDTKAEQLSVTAKQEIADALDALYYGQPCTFSVPAPVKKLKISEKLRLKQNGGGGTKTVQKKEERTSVPSKVRSADPHPQNERNLANGRSGQHPETNRSRRSPAPHTPPAVSALQNSQQPTQAAIRMPHQSAPSQNTLQNEAPEYKNGFSVKGVSKEQFDAMLEKVRKIKGVATKTYIEFTGKPSELITVEVLDPQKQKSFLRYMPYKKSLSLQGKRSGVYAEIQMLLTGAANVHTAITSHIQSGGEDQKTAAVERRLKKQIPSSFEYLSEQSKIDLTIGLVDIYNDQIKLSDYSVLLVPPYRGLERLIYDLQAAEGIEVKMIGQGFEKQADGTYCLKAGYRKRISSIVYNEVMSALYTEYFTERHFLTHSDNTDPSVSRGIREISDARKKFENLLAVIEYNCKKLKEIGFSLEQK